MSTLAAAGKRLRHAAWRAGTLRRAGLIAPLRPDKYLRMGQVFGRYGVTPTTGFSLAAVRRPHATALVDELGSLTWADLESRSDALAAGLAQLRTPSGAQVRTVAVLCRNHRGFVDSLAAAGKLGADALLLNTGFSGPQLSDVVAREQAELVIYDEEFEGLVEHARRDNPDLMELVAWQDHPRGDTRTVEAVIAAHRGPGSRTRPDKPGRPGKVILLTSGTTGTPKGARRSAGGGTDAMAAMLDRIPWRAEETVVVAAPMFHAWGFGQLAIAATLACTVVTRRRFDPEATLAMVRDHDATGLAVVPVMLERIMELPTEVLDRYRLPTLRFVTASGSRMRPDSVIAFMDRFGDVIYNSYNATEAGLITTATPADLRVAPDTAGRPVVGTELRILDEEDREVPAGEVGRITVRSGFQFEGYTSGDTKAFHEDYMVSGDVGRVDESGRLYVVGRDDEMIVSGGENVYPLEVEETIGAHPAVRDVAVIGVDDEKFGQRLAAYVVREPGTAEVTADDIRAHVKQQLAGYKVPRDVTFLDELPRNASGKVMKRELPEHATAPTAEGRG